MSSSIQSGANSQHGDELARLRRRVVADGYSSAHSCQHCDEVIIIPERRDDTGYMTWRRARNERTVLVTEEEMRQHAAAGCNFWSMVLDELDYEILLEKRGDFAAGEPGSVALSDEESRALERLRDRCISQNKTARERRSQRTVAETCVNYVKVRTIYTVDRPGSAHARMQITAHENGFKRNVSIIFTVFTLPGGPQVPGDRYALVCPPNIDPGSAQSFQLIHTWMQRCALEHGCGISDYTPSSMPTMLLSLDKVDKCGTVRLMESKHAEKQRYLALSYCWGHRQKKVLTTTTLDEYSRDGIRLAELDATIQDSIRVTVNLGYLYLWVDALCIIQDNSELRDSEIGRMDSIYENASITIVAAGATSVSQGFLTQRQPVGALTPDHVFSVAYKPSEEQKSPQKNAVILVPHQKDVTRPPLEPWESRAWTLQEDLLSSRQLRFGTRQTSWLCYCSQEIYEDFDGWIWADLEHAEVLELKEKQLGRLGNILRRPDDWVESVEVAREYWCDMLETFSRRALSFQEDRLPAVSAVSRRMARVLGDEYWCGIWRSNAPYELLWSHVELAADNPCTQGAGNFGREGPSWTWASHRGGITFAMGFEFIDLRNFKVDVNFEIVEHVAKYKSPRNIYGAVTAARLRVRGLVRPAPFGLHECHALGWRVRGDENISTCWQFGEGPDGKLRRIFVDKGVVHLDRSILDLLADPNCDLESKQILLLLVGHNSWEKRPWEKRQLGEERGPLGLLLLDEGGNEFSRLGSFCLCGTRRSVYPDATDSYQSEDLTGDEQTELFHKLWGGKSSVKEIVLI